MPNPYHCTVSVANIDLEVDLDRDETISEVRFQGNVFDVDDLYIGRPGKSGEFMSLETYLQEQAIEQLAEEGGFKALDEAEYGDRKYDESREDA